MNLVTRAKNMITNPKTEWNVVAAEQPNTTDIIMRYVLPFSVLGAIAAFIGYGFIYGLLGSVSLGLYFAVIQVVKSILGILLTAYVADLLAPSFASEKNYGRSLQLVAYGATPALIATLFSILPFLAAIILIAGGIYSIYLWYLGLGPVKKTPEDKKVVYLLVTFLVLLVVYYLIGLILARLLLPLFGIGYGLYGI